MSTSACNIAHTAHSIGDTCTVQCTVLTVHTDTDTVLAQLVVVRQTRLVDNKAIDASFTLMILNLPNDMLPRDPAPPRPATRPAY